MLKHGQSSRLWAATEPHKVRYIVSTGPKADENRKKSALNRVRFGDGVLT
jgi:hypothetical protein